MKQTEIYLDHAATTSMAPEARSHLFELLESGVANSSSAHRPGTKAAALLEVARETIATKLGSLPSEIIFCSGGTEANNWVLQRSASDWKRTTSDKSGLPHIITASTEHSSVSNTAARMKEDGLIAWDEVQVDALGYVDLANLKSLIQANTVLVSVSHGNNEIGTIQDLEKIGTICRERGVRFHADACQSFCHTEFQINTLPVDLMTLSGHKVRGPKGVGALYIRKGIEISPLVYGGKQEKGLRPGTTSVELISAFAKASTTWTSKTITDLSQIKRHTIDELKKRFHDVQFNGEVEKSSLCHVLSFTFPKFESKVLHRQLADELVACSTGAACGTGKSDRSAVLLAMRRDDRLAHQLRFSFSPTTTTTEIDEALNRLKKIISTL